MRIRFAYGILAATLFATGTGCGGHLVKVQGTVTLDGQPLEGATVMFIPVDGVGKPGVGATDQDGVFELSSSNKPQDGVAPGDYKVVITIGEPRLELGLRSGFTKGELEGAYFKAKAERDKAGGVQVPAIPAAYKQASTTPLQQHVPPDGPVVINLPSAAPEPPKRPGRVRQGDADFKVKNQKSR